MQISLMRLALLGGTAAATSLLLSGCGALHPEEGKVYALNGIAEEKHPSISEIATGNLGGLIGQAFTTRNE